ncbi:GH116 family glycosyl-hydrolase [Paenibacillus agaridevorans]|uniref:GH116 family glycosyl-hydrolase n=1 Tax=Paenibacillus agaridevorans TaxID=171404 RepID=UPI001BE40816|nr:GH116 family glycosyl-hydrolase [Paenibacillus agaridevorans]
MTNRYFNYEGYRTKEISFPLGGIGSGCIGLAGNGRLIDWEIFNRPNKMSHNGFSFFAIKAESEGSVKLAKVLHGDQLPSYTGEGRGVYEGYGYGPRRENMSGFPHFSNTSFKGEFPFAEITYDDEGDPVTVKLTAFNPLIPLNDKDSSLPAAVFTFEVCNRTLEPLDISLVGNVSNPFKKGAINTYFDQNSFKGFKLHSNSYKEDDPEYGDITLSTDGEDISYQSYWYRGGWFDNLTVFWKDFTTPGKFQERFYPYDRNLDDERAHQKRRDVCLLSNHKSLAPGEKGMFTFILSWNIPNYINYWNPGEGCREPSCTMPSWKNYYSLLFADSTETSKYIFANYDRLYKKTSLFKQLLFQSSFPQYVLDAISANISILKSPTVLRLPDGTLYGFEGCHSDEGSCEGSCTHVWNYEQVTPFLFPGLARSMRNIDYSAAQFPNGKMAFRLLLPPERTTTEISHNTGTKQRAAADGQMGGIMKVYREWKISGNTEWLKSIWPEVKKALEYAWDTTNEDWWDRDKDGVMEGEQHHTLDVEIYGPNSYITGLYHGALLAASLMADALGDKSGLIYREMYEIGRKWMDDNLFNGEYFYQKIDLQDSRFPVDPELGEIKYQIGEGCHIDQVLGQWHAHIIGLGYIIDQQKVRKSVESIYKYNFINCLRDYPNACRIYGLNDEQGLLISTWPKGNSPKVPVPYADECMNGFEYQAACHMIYEGMIDEGLECVKAIRHRYDGERRNPWNEFECGSNYVRSMASYSLLLALSGFEYDMTEGYIGFNPVINCSDFSTFWSLNEGWGQFTHHEGKLEFSVKYGRIGLNKFRSEILEGKEIRGITVAGRTISYVRDGIVICFNEVAILKEDESITITI